MKTKRVAATRCEFEPPTEKEYQRDYHFRPSVSYGKKLAPRILPQLQQILKLQSLSDKGLYTLESFVASGINAQKNYIHNGWVAISLDENIYEKTGIYDDFSYFALRKQIWNAMLDAAWIEVKPHHKYYHSEGEGRRTCYRFTQTALTHLYQIEENIDQIPQIDLLAGLSICKYRNFYEDTKNDKIVPPALLPDHVRAQLDAAERKLHVINQYNLQQSTAMSGPGLESPQYTQVGFWDGKTYIPGRIYSKASTMPSAIRNTQWKIKGQTTAELDLKASHLALMYAAKGLKLQTDAYSIPEYHKDSREFIKFVTQCMINAPNKQAAKKAILKQMAKKGRNKKNPNKLSIWESYCYSLIHKNKEVSEIVRLANILGLSTKEIINTISPDIADNIRKMKKYYNNNPKSAMDGCVWLCARGLGKQRDWSEDIAIAKRIDYIYNKVKNCNIVQKHKTGVADLRYDNLLEVEVYNKSEKYSSGESGKCLVDVDSSSNGLVVSSEISSVAQSLSSISSIYYPQILVSTVYILDTGLVTACIQTLFWLFFDSFLVTLYGDIMRHHQPISDLFGCDIGIHMQGLEGLVAIDVLHHCSLSDIPVVNIHDGFYCAESDVDAVHQVLETVLLRLPTSPFVVIERTIHQTLPDEWTSE